MRMLMLSLTIAFAPAAARAFVAIANDQAHIRTGSDFKVNTNDFPEGQNFHEAIQSETNEWDAGATFNIRGATFTLDHASFTGLSILFDGKNHIYRGGLPDGVLGRATWWHPPTSNHFDECDININDDPRLDDGSAVPWTTVAPPATGRASLNLTVLHELGHCVGLDHDDSHGNLMVTTSFINDEGPFVGESNHTIVGEDERRWLRTIHGDGSTGQNLAVTTFICCNDDGSPTNYDVSASRDVVADEIIVDFTFGYLNLGTATQTAKVTFRLIPESSPVWPAGWDRDDPDALVVDETNMTVGPNDPYEPTKQVRFAHPGDQAYYIGAFIDSDEAIAETNETNNTIVSRCKVESNAQVVCDR